MPSPATAMASALGDDAVRGQAGPVILVDERRERRGILREIFLAAGVPAGDIREADDVAAATELVETAGDGVIVMERQFPVRESLAAITRLRGRYPLVTIVVCSFGRDLASEQLELAAGVDCHLDKPLRTADVRQVAGRGARGAS